MKFMRRILVLIVGALLVAGCATRVPAYAPRSVASAELELVRESVRGHAKVHCGRCHIASLPTSLPAALAIYNLDAKAWSSTLTAGQLRDGFPRRLLGQLDEAGQRDLKTFIEGELALRRQ